MTGWPLQPSNAHWCDTTDGAENLHELHMTKMTDLGEKAYTLVYMGHPDVVADGGSLIFTQRSLLISTYEWSRNGDDNLFTLSVNYIVLGRYWVGHCEKQDVRLEGHLF